jgi:hypothetical protein
MAMKDKPKDLDKFLRSGAATEQPTRPPRQQRGETRRQKVVELPEKMLYDLKRRSVEESEKAGRRVTETEMIEEAIKRYLYG